MEPELREMLTDQIVLEHFVDDDEYADQTYSAPATLAARVLFKPRYIRTSTGDQRTASTTIIVEGDPSIGLRDRITLPDQTQPPIMQVFVAKDEKGAAHHTRIWM